MGGTSQGFRDAFEKYLGQKKTFGSLENIRRVAKVS